MNQEKPFLDHLSELVATSAPTLEIRGSDEAVGDLMSSIAEIGNALNAINKGTKGRAGSQVYSYANIADIMREVRPACQAAGITILQPMHTPSIGICRITTILAKGAARIVSALDYQWSDMTTKDSREPIKDQGKVTTYLRRYALQSILVLAGEDADDEDTRTRTPSPSRKAESPEHKAAKRAIMDAATAAGVKLPNLGHWIEQVTGISFDRVRSDTDAAVEALELIRAANDGASAMEGESDGE